jgi:hypothetical protein
MDVEVGNMALHGAMLHVIDEQNHTVIDTRSRTVVSRDGLGGMTHPYGVAVNPETGEIFVTDAKNYITHGTLHCFSPDRTLKWSVTTGDIPAHIAFTTVRLQPAGNTPTPKPDPDPDPDPDPKPEPEPDADVTVFEYMPAPGQFINDGYTVRTQAEAIAHAEKCLKEKAPLSLGGFGGYIVMGLGRTIANGTGADFAVGGNSFEGSSEPAVVWVMRDENGNGRPDDTWYELAGSATPAETLRDYAVTYHRPAGERQNVRWVDSEGAEGTIDVNTFHKQPSYYPAWVDAASYTLRGTRLASRTRDDSGNGTYYINVAYGWGYADNFGSDYTGGAARLDIDNAIGARLAGIDFVKVQTAVNVTAGWLGELSTEVTGLKDL